MSVIIPARNEERWIRGALESVVAQRWPPAGIEVIVVDNGSTDGTAAAVQAFAAAHPFLALQLVREPQRGVARAKNRAVSAARGRWLVFLDADSRMAPDLLTQVLAWACRGYPAGSIRIVADSDDWLDRAFFNLLEFGKRLFGIRAQMFYCERELFLSLHGFDETLQLAEDREFLVRVQRAGIPVCHVTTSWIATSPRRLHALPCRLGMVTMLGRWALAYWGIGRRWRY
ncbi:MAG: glycosyltransferase [Chloroflexota bacterium]